MEGAGYGHSPTGAAVRLPEQDLVVDRFGEDEVSQPSHAVNVVGVDLGQGGNACVWNAYEGGGLQTGTHHKRSSRGGTYGREASPESLSVPGLTCVDEKTGVWMMPVGKDLVASFHVLDSCGEGGANKRLALASCTSTQSVNPIHCSPNQDDAS